MSKVYRYVDMIPFLVTEKMVQTAQTNHRSVQRFTGWQFRKYPGINQPRQTTESEGKQKY